MSSGLPQPSRVLDEEAAVGNDFVEKPSGEAVSPGSGLASVDGHSTKIESSPELDNSDTEKDILWVDFEPDDPRKPVNFSRGKKWVFTAIACTATFLTAFAVGTYNLGFESMVRDLHTTEFRATIGLTTYALGFAVIPMVTAAFSEEFGRRPLYVWTSIGFTIMFLMIALAPNIQTVIVARFLQGGFASTGATMVGGTIADIWVPAERGFPMAWFALAACSAIGFGPTMAGWVEMNSKLEWKWIQWIQMIISGVFCLFVIFFLQETRSTIVLNKIAKEMRKKTGDNRYRARIETPDIKKLIWISCTRSLRLLFTEPVVTSFTLWIGFCWGVLFCLVESISSVFQTLHGFSVGQTGTVFITISIGSFFGFLTSLYQERLYQKYYPIKGTEARLFAACVAAVLLPIAMFIYAWCSYPWVHWISLCIGIVLFMWGTFIVYLSVFAYLADCYGPYASSALAGQSLFRNCLSAVFPLFTQQMYRHLTFKWANTLFAFIALLLLPIPFVLFYFGPKIRLMSKFSRKAIEART